MIMTQQNYPKPFTSLHSVAILGTNNPFFSNCIFIQMGFVSGNETGVVHHTANHCGVGP